MSAATKHTCAGPVFGKLTDGCPRCEELKAGAPARAAHFNPAPKFDREQFSRDFAAAQRKADAAGIPCTFGEW